MLDDKTTLNIAFLITTVGTVGVQWLTANRAQAKLEKVHAETQQIHKQTDGTLAKMETRLAEAEKENKALRDRLIDLALLTPAANQIDRTKVIRASDLTTNGEKK